MNNDLVIRRRKCTLEFFLAIESFGESKNKSSEISYSSRLQRVHKKGRKGWPIFKPVDRGILGRVQMKEPVMYIASVNGSPLSISSCIGYVPMDNVRGLFGQNSTLTGSLTFHPGLDDIGKSKKSESYKHLLVFKSSSMSTESEGSSDLSSYSSLSTSSSSEDSCKIPDRYDPLFLDDPELTTGRHKTIINLPGCITSVIHYVGEDEIKKEINERFRQMHPYIESSISLTKIRNLKRLLVKAAIDCDLELVPAAMSHALVEKLILAGHVVKANRRVCGACCLLLCAKVCDCKEKIIHDLVLSLSKALKIPAGDIVKAEFSVLVSLSFSIQISQFEYLPHFERIFTDLEYCNFQEYLGEKMYNLWTKYS